MAITTLFNLFCPVFSSIIEINNRVFCLRRIVVCITVVLISYVRGFYKIQVGLKKTLSMQIFSRVSLGWLLSLVFINLGSLVCFNYPFTATLSFNLVTAISLWLRRVLILSNKPHAVSCVLPKNSPRYLVPFLRVVELIRIGIRPLTLCFRLLANMRAGHILLALVCKVDLWIIGLPFGLLELIVSVVQAFVFLILVVVYLEEALSHWGSSLGKHYFCIVETELQDFSL